ncbi:MAG: alpha/beta fold hydrolase [Candidatus Helarchaeota archaeon]
MPYIELDDGVKMWYEIYGGNGERNLLMYHGWGASIAFWSEQIPMLIEKGYRVIAFDGRGHGKSDKPRKGYNLDRLRQDFKNFLEAINLDEWAIIGHSAGGGVAQITYHDYQDRTKALVLIDTSYTIVETFQQKLFWKVLPIPLTITLTPLLRWSIRAISTASVPIIATILNKPVETVTRWVEDLNAVPNYVIIEEIKEIANYDLEGKLKDIRVPTCLICGEWDTITPLSMMRKMQKEIQNAQLCAIKNAGHFALITQSAQVNKCLGEFLEKNYPV